MPCILLEPFFIDNDKDLEKATSNKDKLIQNIVEAFDNVADEVLIRAMNGVNDGMDKMLRETSGRRSRS